MNDLSGQTSMLRKIGELERRMKRLEQSIAQPQPPTISPEEFIIAAYGEDGRRAVAKAEAFFRAKPPRLADLP